MADITDVQVITWSNTKARQSADQMSLLYKSLMEYQNTYAAQGIAARITAAGASGNVLDGAAQDGRSICTGTNLINLKAAIDQLKTSFDTNVAGVGAPVTTIVNTIKVNG